MVQVSDSCCGTFEKQASVCPDTTPGCKPSCCEYNYAYIAVILGGMFIVALMVAAWWRQRQVRMRRQQQGQQQQAQQQEPNASNQGQQMMMPMAPAPQYQQPSPQYATGSTSGQPPPAYGQPLLQQPPAIEQECQPASEPARSHRVTCATCGSRTSSGTMQFIFDHEGDFKHKEDKDPRWFEDNDLQKYAACSSYCGTELARKLNSTPAERRPTPVVSKPTIKPSNPAPKPKPEPTTASSKRRCNQWVGSNKYPAYLGYCCGFGQAKDDCCVCGKWVGSNSYNAKLGNCCGFGNAAQNCVRCDQWVGSNGVPAKLCMDCGFSNAADNCAKLK